MAHKKIKLIAPILLFTVLISITNAQDSISIFPDIETTHTNYTAIEYTQKNGIFTGYPDGTFQPDRVLNRAEQLKVFMLLDGVSPNPDTYKNCFPDVTTEWFAKYVCYAKEKGIVQGYPDATFRPSQLVNKAETLKMLGELQNWPFVQSTNTTFEDVPLDAWYAPYVAFAKEQNLLEETGTKLEPGQGISRAKTAELIFRSLAPEYLQKPYSSQIITQIQEIILSFSNTENSKQIITVQSITPENGSLKVDQPYEIIFTAGTDLGKDVDIQDLEIFFLQPYVNTDEAGNSPLEYFTAEKLTDDAYSVKVQNTKSGTGAIVFKDAISGTTQSVAINYLPGTPSRIDIHETHGLAQNSIKTRKYSVALHDNYNNIIPGAEIKVTSNTGSTAVKKMTDGTAEVSFTAEKFGMAELNISSSFNGITKQQKILVDVLPFGLGGAPGHLTEADYSAEIPLLLFIPENPSDANEFQIQLEIPAELPLIGFSPTGVLSDLVNVEVILSETNFHQIFISGNYPSEEGEFSGVLGDIMFEEIPEGQHEIAGSITLTSEQPDYAETLYMPGNGTIVQAGENSVYVPIYSRPFPPITGKTQKTICIDAFIEPGIGVTLDQVKSDAAQAEDIFYKNALNCNCPHFIKIDVSGMTLSQADWQTLTGDDNQISHSNITDMVKNRLPVAPRSSCTPVVYTDDIEERGSSFRDSETDDLSSQGKIGANIMVNNGIDSDGRTLAHELAHHLSGQRIEDPKRGAAQGAGSDDNLMSYDEADEEGNITRKVTGDDLTKTQCDLISWDHWRFGAYPPNQ